MRAVINKQQSTLPLQSHDAAEMPAAAYVRMSTEHQQYSTENQLDKIKEYAARRKMNIVRVFEDAGKSGLSTRNPTRTDFRDIPVGKFTPDRFGYPNWWKLVFPQYILAHPKPAYAIREFQRHLRSQKLQIENKHLRRFCQFHAITRDTRPGRPKNEK